MKKEKFLMLLRSKGFYLSLLTGILAVFALCFVVLNTVNVNKQNNDLTDLNELSAEKQGEQQEIVNQEQQTDQEKANSLAKANENTQNIVNNDSLLENDVESVDANNQQNENANTEEQTEGNLQVAEEAAEAVTQGENISSELTFDEEAGLLWPVSGNVLMNYSMDKGIYFATLGQYKCNPAVIIEAKVGTEVKSATKAIVTSIEKDEETGLTVTTDIGNGYKAVYGQLEDLQIKKGQTIEEGAVIGKIAEPTKYYVVEGSNLYFQLIEDEQTVNPLLLLR